MSNEQYLTKYLTRIREAVTDENLLAILDEIYSDGYTDAVNEVVDVAVPIDDLDLPNEE